jgi:NitT/TauT family transport system ATP-binding protein
MLEINITSKSFGAANGASIDVIKDMHFTVPDNAFTCIIGPSGCGKTTTLKIMLGIEQDYVGSVDLAGLRVSPVFQEPRLLPWRTVRQNVELCLPETLRHSDLTDLYASLGLTELLEFYPSELSLGLARRVALARAFATVPDLLILDEPFVSLDNDTAVRLRQLLLSVWLARPTTAFMVTHNIREAAQLADYILILCDRPTRVIGEVAIDQPREERDERCLDDLVKRIEAAQTEG